MMGKISDKIETLLKDHENDRHPIIENLRLREIVRLLAAKLDEVPTKEDMKQLRETFVHDINVKDFHSRHGA